MSRQPNAEKAAIIERAMHYFWENGYRAASVDDLVKELATTRFSLYQLFGGKEGLFRAALDHYSDIVVGEALHLVKLEPGGIDGIKRYFEHLITTAQKANCLARGCLMANSMVEFGDQSGEISKKCDQHFYRIVRAMSEAITRDTLSPRSKNQTDTRALFIATFAQGLWLRARAGDDAKTLRSAYRAALFNL